MKMPVTTLTLEDVEQLRSTNYGTNGKNIEVSQQEVKEMLEHLLTIYSDKVQMKFSENIAIKNKAN